MRLKTLVAALVMCSGFSAAAMAITGEEVMLLNETSRKGETEFTDLYMTLSDDRGRTRSRMLKLRIDDSNKLARKTYAEFYEPKDVKGTRFLTLEKESLDEEEDRWIYLPALRKVRRIASSDQGESFVGTDFTYEDMEISDGVVGVKNHRYTILREEELEDALGVVKKCWVVEAIPVTPRQIRESLYSKRIIWVEQQYHAAIQEFYFNKEGVHFKTRTSADVREIPAGEGKTVWRPNRIEMKNHETGSSTLVLFDQIINKPISSQVFTRRFLETGLKPDM